MPVCSICGRDLICTNPHSVPPAQAGSAVSQCPLKKGAIYVHAKDDLGNGVSGVPVECAGGKALSDPAGFAFFDPLDEGTHTTSIALGSTAALDNKYYVASKPSVDGVVYLGQITLVEFQLDRYSTLKAVVKRSDNGRQLKDVDIKLETSAPGATPATPQKKSLENEPAVFEKLKRAVYKATVTLTGADKENYVIKGAFAVDCSVDPDKDNAIEFLVTPSGWIAFKLVDQRNNPLNERATLSVEPAGQAKADKVCGADGFLRIENLDPGKVKVHQIALDKRYELVEMTSA